ncbi:MBL fold metallo-hydrolase [Pantoea sp.]|uniref:MBL fold metallo-hydrolase n=1 Tax=Pantoea sp. TaxID=69393 RepID=UPI002913E698|nr:MBL fold metallo-hydrolase [Pantoea sp.]MDU5475368.1 MBL fold metallo-hydrolase [Pantoea sp.]
MMQLCATCGTAYAEVSPQRCKICEDERQWVPAAGQQWTDFAALIRSHQNKWQQLEPGLLSIKTVPNFAIGQRALLLRSGGGNILWDCIANLDPATAELIHAIGGLSAIAISHPHYYTTMQAWAEEFNAPIYLHADDRQWVMRDSDAIHFWQGETLPLNSEVDIVRVGGHLAGGSVLHWKANGGVMLAGDIIQVTPGKDAVSFMWSYPNMLPLSAATVSEMLRRCDTLAFSRLYGAFEGQDVAQQAKEIVMQSGARYLRCLT